MNLIPLGGLEALGGNGNECGDALYGRFGMALGNGRAVKRQVSGTDSERTFTIIPLPKSAQENHTPVGRSRSVALQSRSSGRG